MRTVTTVDMTPQWQGVWRLYAQVAVEGTTHDGRTAATSELDRMALLADAFGEAMKAGDEDMKERLRVAVAVARTGGSRLPDTHTEEA